MKKDPREPTSDLPAVRTAIASILPPLDQLERELSDGEPS